MTLQQKANQVKLAERFGRGEISFAEYHQLMHEFYAEV